MTDSNDSNDWGITLTYRDKTWVERRASFDWENLEESYSLTQRFGSEHITNVELWERKLDAPELPQSVVVFNTRRRPITIEVDRDQDLIDLLVHLAPLGTAAMLDLVLGDDANMLELVRAACGDEEARSTLARRRRNEEEAMRRQRNEEEASRRARKNARDKKPT